MKRKQRSFQRLVGKGLEVLERRELLSAVGLSTSYLCPVSVQAGQYAPFAPPPASGLASSPSTMTTASDLGTLSGTKTVTGSVTWYERDDYYSFTIASPGNFDLKLTGLQGDADVRVIQDFNGNKRVDRGEVLAVSGNWGIADERISGTITPGTYYVDV
jgi:hypothetical protein